jgi:polar amino acid transport system permease protein
MSATSVTAAPPRGGRFANVTPAGIAWMVFWFLAAIGIAFLMVSSVDTERFAKYGWRFGDGLWTTVKLVVTSLVLGAVISLPVALGRLSKNPVIGTLAYAYSYFFRGTPLIAQLFLIYYGAGQFSHELRAIGLWWFFRDAFNCALLSFAMNTAAYQSEILSGAIANVPNGQREAAAALGLRRLTTFRKVIMPQALITALRPYGNEIILMIKASAIASIVTVFDLMGQTRYIFSKTYDLSFYLWAAVVYLVLVEILSRVLNLFEARLIRHLHRPHQHRL